MQKEAEINALFKLIDDPDEEVRERGFYHISMLNEPTSQ